MNSAKRFDIIRTIISVLIALAISFVIIFMVSDQPLEAIKYLLIGPLTNKRSMGNVVESMIPLIFTGTGVCIMFSANQINLAGEGAFHIGGLIASCIAIKVTAGISFCSPGLRWSGRCFIYCNPCYYEDYDYSIRDGFLSDDQLHCAVFWKLYA